MNGTGHLDLRSHQTYMDSFRQAVEARLKATYGREYPKKTTKEMQADQGTLLRHLHKDSLNFNPSEVLRYDDVNVEKPEVMLVAMMILDGRFLAEHTLGGSGSRLNKGAKHVKFGQKYFITPEMIARELETSAQGLLPLSFGERHMLAYAFALKEMSKTMGGEHWTKVLDRQSALLVASEEPMVDGKQTCEQEIIQSVKRFDFFGYKPEHVLLSCSRLYPGLELVDGKLREDTAHKRIHNHGIVRMQPCMEEALYVMDKDGDRFPFPRSKYEKLLGRMIDMVSYNVEDLDFLQQPLDQRAIAIAVRFGTEGYKMVMDIAAQKLYPYRQKGGAFVFDPLLFDQKTKALGRPAVVEAFQLDLPPGEKEENRPEDHPYEQALKAMQWLNKNNNHYPNPLDSFWAIADSGLPVHPEFFVFPDGEVRICNMTPQGDTNFLVPTAYVVNEKPLHSLKTAKELRATLEAFRAQDAKPGFQEFVSQFLNAGVMLPDRPFALISRLDETPIDLKTLLAHPWFTQRAGTENIKRLRSLAEVFQVSGSHVYQSTIEGDRVTLEIINESRRGTSKEYTSRSAPGRPTPATEAERLVAVNNWIIGDHKIALSLSYLLVSNRQPDSDQGELIMLVGRYNEDHPADNKPVLLRDKFNGVVSRIQDEAPEIDEAAIKSAFCALSWGVLFETNIERIKEHVLKALATETTPG